MFSFSSIVSISLLLCLFIFDFIWKIFTQVLLAIHAIHNHKEGKILHRDIKPSNIFLDKDNNIKLGDFGLSRELSVESKFAYSHVGTPYYMSPEQIDETKYNEKSDIWSLGCFLYELAALKPPFQARNQIQLAMRIKEGKVEKINKRYSEELWRVIIWMLNTNYEKRPSAEELLDALTEAVSAMTATAAMITMINFFMICAFVGFHIGPS